MADVVSPAVIKKTQDTLGKYVKKPQLSEKLLKKPPFRFLHDVINVVSAEVNFKMSRNSCEADIFILL